MCVSKWARGGSAVSVLSISPSDLTLSAWPSSPCTQCGWSSFTCTVLYSSTTHSTQTNTQNVPHGLFFQQEAKASSGRTGRRRPLMHLKVMDDA
jgi:hypothetical protein